jgi:hypothetical protein
LEILIAGIDEEACNVADFNGVLIEPHRLPLRKRQRRTTLGGWRVIAISRGVDQRRAEDVVIADQPGLAVRGDVQSILSRAEDVVEDRGIRGAIDQRDGGVSRVATGVHVDRVVDDRVPR